MARSESDILSVNVGSSSIKFALFQSDTLSRKLRGKIDRIGTSGSAFTFERGQGPEEHCSVSLSDRQSAGTFLIDWLEKQIDFNLIAAAAHRIVYGMDHVQPEPVTPELLAELGRISSIDPDHMPAEIELLARFRARKPDLPQIACFDTAFHATLPNVARLLALPRRFGLRRYGFHGLSCAFLMEELARMKNKGARVILAHLGGGASLTAIMNGKSVDTSMGFSTAAGVPMGTRSGDLDPGAAWYLMKTEKLTPDQFNRLIHHECGLLGVSETSSDMRDLLSRETSDTRAAEAVAFFCYQVKKWIGAFAASLGGLDTVVFSGGIGENSPVIRERICDGLEFLGIQLDRNRNRSGGGLISAGESPVNVYALKTDEAFMMAKLTAQCLTSAKEGLK